MHLHYLVTIRTLYSIVNEHAMKAAGILYEFQKLTGRNSYGGGERDRTDDLLRARQALSQLSYTPI